tara:strand:- start:1430 stop:1594 length:165 start_codon:yes stop_codon:yes gene_type:complete
MPDLRFERLHKPADDSVTISFFKKASTRWKMQINPESQQSGIVIQRKFNGTLQS